MAALLLLASLPNPKHIARLSSLRRRCYCSSASSRRREIAVQTAAAISAAALSLVLTLPSSAQPETARPRKPMLEGIANTKSWFQFFGNGFSIRVPPSFQDIMEPEDYNAGLSLYGDKVKPKTYAARFASPDGSEIVSVVIRPTNQLKITFLEAKDITDLGSLKKAAKIFVPGGANLFSARTIKIMEDESLRTYYFYEFGLDEQHVALVVAVNSGKAYIAGSAAPKVKWQDDGRTLSGRVDVQAEWQSRTKWRGMNHVSKEAEEFGYLADGYGFTGEPGALQMDYDKLVWSYG